MGFIARASIQEVSDRLDAVAVVEDYVRLEKKGGRWWGRCPFHAGGQEKTPSFTVDPDKKMYHCFGCGKGGGVIGFVMEMDKITFPEAVKLLARKAGVSLVYEDPGGGAEERENPDEQIKEQLYELYSRAAGTFHYFLTKKSDFRAAFEYIVSRGIDAETIEKFRLGYAPPDRNWLHRFLREKSYSPEFLAQSGLFSANYPRAAFFSNRLMFPILDRQGRTVAFGGRDMPMLAERPNPDAPRYLNSRDSDIFKKGQTLFAVHLALDEIRRSKTVYIAEGYMDVIAMHQAGITNAVAPLGTAFTDDQAKLLKRWAERAVLVFDSDAAGQNAALKGILTCRRNGLSCALTVPESGADAAENGVKIKDPADILQKSGAQALNKSMKCYINDFEYLIFRSKALYDVSVPDGKRAAMVFLFPFLETLDSEIERNDCIEAAADAFGTDREAARKDYEGRRREGRPRQAEAEESGEPVRMNDELFVLVAAAVNPEIYPALRRALEIREIENPDAKELFVALEECFVNEENSMDALLARIGRERLRNFVVRRGASAEFRGGGSEGMPARLAEDGIKRIKGKRLRARLAEIVAELHQSERNPGEISPAALDGLLSEKMRIDADIRKLEGR